MIAFASSLDQAGILSSSVGDSASVLQAMAGHDPGDSTSANVPVPNYEESLQQSISGMTIGIPREYCDSDMPESTLRMLDAGIEWLQKEGAQIKEISLAGVKYALAAYYVIAPAEASSNLSRYDGIRYGRRHTSDDINELYAATRGKFLGNEVKRRILTGTYVLSLEHKKSFYEQANGVRKAVAAEFRKAFSTVDAIMTPTTVGAVSYTHLTLPTPPYV